MRSLLRLIRFTNELRGLYLIIIVCSVTAAIGTLAVPFIIGAATDVIVDVVNGRVALADGLVATMWFAAAFLVAELAVTLITSVGGWFGDLMSERMRQILSNRYFDKLLQLPQRYFDDNLTGTIVSRLDRTITEVTHFAKSFANNFFTMIITTVAVLVISGFYAWPLALLLLVIFPVYVWLTTLTSRRWQVYEGEKNAEVDAARGRFAEVVSQMPVVKSFAQERRERDHFHDRFARTVAITRHQSRHWHLMDALRRAALNLIFFGIYAIIFVLTAQGQFTLGVMVLLIQLMNMARQPVTMMSYIIDTAQHALAGSRDYFSVMELEPDPRELLDRELADDELVPKPGSAAIEFSHVNFAYDSDPVLRDLSFSVAEGERIALVSESGGGKSTIVSVLLGFYPVADGHVRLFGHDTAKLHMKKLREKIGVVFQDASLFSGTIRENIAYARPDASDAEIIAAAKRANAWAFIARSQEGLDTVIGERGLKLSGGQKQRIAVARAMLKDAPVLILDEATSALDTKSERLVQAGIDELMRGRTSLIIAHRLSTISSVDRIITLRHGEIDEVGSPAELATTGGIYAELLALQQEGTARSKKALRERYGIRG